MNFTLTTEQEMLRKMAREFAERELVPTAKDYDKSGEYPYEIYKKMAPLGLLGVLMPPQYGGLGLKTLDWIVMCEQLAWGSLSAAAVTQNAMLPGSILVDAGNDEQKEKYLPPMCRGEKIYAMAAAEPEAGSDGGNIQTTAVLDGDSYVLNGGKVFITNGSVADMAIVLAQTDKSLRHKGLALIIVERGTPGFSTSELEWEGLPSDDLAQVRLADCRVPRENLVNEVGKGLKLALGGINNMRVAIAAYCVGVAQRCLDICSTYVMERSQFSKPLGSFQLIQEMIADMAVNIDAARLLTYRAAFNKDNGLPYEKEISMAKLFATDMAIDATVNGIKLHGGYGTFDDYVISRLHREVLGFLAPGGTSEVHKMTIGRKILNVNALSR